jgi:hypothetical protein
MQGLKYKNNLACHFNILLGALISYGLPSMYFRLPLVKFGLQFGHWQAAISSPGYRACCIALNTVGEFGFKN